MATKKKVVNGEQLKKQEEEENEVDAEEKDEDEHEEKSLDLSDADLEKSLDLLSELAVSGDAKSRKDELLGKAQAGDLAKAERQELFDLLGDKEPAKDSFGADIVKSLKDNDTLQKALDVSDYLDAQHDELCKSLTTLGDRVESSDSRQHTFNLVLAKALVETGKMVKGMSERLGVLAEQPARGPKSQGLSGAQPLHKSFAGAAVSEDQLSKSQILDTIEDMLVKSEAGTSPSGEDLVLATAKYEQTNMVSPRLLSDIKNHRSTAVA